VPREAGGLIMADTYQPHHLETAACLWEAVLDFEQCPIDGIADADRTPREQLAADIAAARENIGSSGLRNIIIGWTDEVDASWNRVDGFEHGRRLANYGGAFDWEFVPEWLALNVDWSSNYPALRSPLRDPENPTALAPKPLDPRQGMAPDLAGWLIGEMGMEFELCGGGATALRHYGAHGWSIMVTQAEGGGLPSWDDWHVGVYCPEDASNPKGEEVCVWNTASAHSHGAMANPISLRAAVAMACSLIAESAMVAPEPVAIVDVADDLAEALENLTLAIVDPDNNSGNDEKASAANDSLQNAISASRALLKRISVNV
jgi:hypothetical protein